MKRGLILVLLVVIGLTGMFSADLYYRSQIREENERALTQVVADIRNRLQVSVNTRLLAVADLQAFMLAEPTLPSSKVFDQYAAATLGNYPEIRALQYVDPDRIIRYIYPLAGNEAALGLDISTQWSAPFIEKAISEKRTTVSDPTETIQGSFSIIARAPLYREDELVGVVQVVFDVSSIGDEALAGTDTRFDIRLGDEQDTFFWGTEIIQSQSQTVLLPVGDNQWYLTVGWAGKQPAPDSFILAIIWGGGSTLLFSLLLIIYRALAEGENRFRQLARRNRKILETTLDGYILADREGQIVEVNPAYCQLVGYTQDELRQMSLYDLEAEPDMAKVEAWIQEMIDVGSLRFEIKHRHRNGRILDLEVSTAIMNDPDGPLVAAFLRDVTEQNTAVTALRESQSLLNAVIEGTTDAVFVKDVNGRYLLANTAAANMVGKAASVFIGQDDSFIFAPDDAAVIKANDDRVMSNRQTITYEEMLILADDQPHSFLATKGPVFDIHGEVMGMFGISRDIDQIKQAEQALRESEERYRLLVNQSPFAIAVHMDGCITFVNPAAVRLLGAESADNLIGLPIGKIVAPENWSAAAARISQMLQGKQGLYPSEDRYVRLDGIIVPVEVRAAPFIHNGQPAVQVIALDITERKQAAEDLQRLYLAEQKQRALAEALQDTVVGINRAKVLDEVLDAIMENLTRVVAHDARDMMLVRDGAAYTVRVEGDIDVDYAGWQEAVVLPIETTADLKEMIETRRPQYIPDVYQLESWVPIAETRWIRSCITAPIFIGETAVGFISIYSQHPHQFSDDDAQRLEGFVEQAAVGIEKVQLIANLEQRVAERTQSLERQYKRQSALAEIELAISEPSELQGVLKRIARLVHDYLPTSEGASVILWDAVLERFTISATTIPGQDDQLVSKQARHKKGATRWIVDNKKPLVVVDTQDDPFGANRMLDDFSLRAYAGVPILDGHRSLGVLYALESKPRKFTKDDVGFMQIIAARAAVVIIKVGFYEELKTANALLANRGKALKARNQELETFTYSVSHDLKAPLRGIDGYSRLLLEEYESKLDDDGRFFLQTIRKATAQMTNLIDDLLLYSRLERREMKADPVSPQVLIGTLVVERAEEIAERGVEVSVDLPETAVMADPDGLVMALRNLLDNALKFTRDIPQPMIEIGGRETERSCIIWVRDNGTGFEMKFHDRIFEIFQRLHRAEEYPGTGIGLAIVQKAMQRMNGRVWAESQSGQGATFYLEVPRSL